jgi:hypothetical protein
MSNTPTTRISEPGRVSLPSEELRRLEPLVGDWDVAGYAEESLAGPACAVESHESFEWLDGGYFLVHRYETHFGDQPVQRGVMYWGFDELSMRFRLIFFSNNGPFTTEGNVYSGELRAAAIVCTGPARFTMALDEEGNIAMGADQRFEIAWELRDAEDRWRPWMRDRYVRVK